jgi:hypothetical protein
LIPYNTKFLPSYIRACSKSFAKTYALIPVIIDLAVSLDFIYEMN